MSTDDALDIQAAGDGEPVVSAYAERLRISAAARASLLASEHLRLHDDLQGLRRKASTSSS
jgi:hypothetical protein